ncbi:MAG: hypothetical protein IKA17_00400 [Clostridia bacterium]|nr:hypothetical protein [Clostridia bacterium]
MVFLKKMISAIISLILIFALANTALAVAQPADAQMEAEGALIYQKARGYFGRSFNGYCGSYVKHQLMAMGIFSGKYDASGNGNKWYGNFENIQKTSGGYYVYRESGNDCLKKLSEKYGNDLKNIVLSFPIQANYSAANPGAGHALVIRYMKDGVCYYSESFSFGSFREGQMLMENADELIERYSRRHGEALGCVYFSEKDLSVEADVINKTEITEGIVDTMNFVLCYEEFMQKIKA